MCATRTPPVPTWVPPHAFPPIGCTVHLLPLLDTSSSQTARLTLPTLPSTCTPTSTATCLYTTFPDPCYTPHFTLLVLHSHIARWEKNVLLSFTLYLFLKQGLLCCNVNLLPQGVALSPIIMSEALVFSSSWSLSEFSHGFFSLPPPPHTHLAFAPKPYV